jgi:protein TonB
VSRRADALTAGIAVLIHAGLGFAIARVSERPRAVPRPVLLQFERRAEAALPLASSAPAVATSPPTAPPKAARKLSLRAPAPRAPARARAPVAAAAAVEDHATRAPSAPAFAVAMASPTDATSAVSAPQGAGAGPAGRPSSSGGAPGYAPASAGDVGIMPEVDTEACGHAAAYPRDAEQTGTEGDVRLRVSLTERGAVHAVRVLAGLGHGLDDAAVDAIKHRCKFSPARGRDGQPVAFVIESYTFHFELPR